MSDPEYIKFKEWGGGERLRRMFNGQPASYYNVFQRPEVNKSDAAFINRKKAERND